MCDILVLYLDQHKHMPPVTYTTYQETFQAINTKSVVQTTQPAFLQFKYAKRLYVVVNDKIHEITLGKCEGTDREIHEAHNIEKMLLNGAFDYFRGI